MWRLKKRCFSNVEDLTVVTPSKWLESVVLQSYLGTYECKVIYNGVNLSTYRPVESCFRNKYDIGKRKIVLGVAAGWEKRKGLDVMIALSNSLNNQYQIVLVGTNNAIDNELPSNIISIHHTDSIEEMVQIYSAADVFANPTRDEVFGLVNVEALACGTPVVTFDAGGCPEIIDDSCGRVVPVNGFDSMKAAIIDICERKPFSREDCRARAMNFDQEILFDSYIDLYR